MFIIVHMKDMMRMGDYQSLSIHIPDILLVAACTTLASYLGYFVPVSVGEVARVCA